MFPSIVPLSGVRSMNIYRVSSTTMNVRWDEAKGATGYKIIYKTLNTTQPSLEKEVSRCHTEHFSDPPQSHIMQKAF